jgi:sn-2 palmitoyl-lipid 9-desaturase
MGVRTLTFHNKLLTLVYSCQVIGIAGLIYYWDPIYLLWTVLGKLLFYSFGVEIGLHRYLSHRSFSMAKWKERILLVLSMFACYGSTLGWCANHRVHHTNADKTKGDPHPSKQWFKTWFWINTEKNVTISPTVIKDLLKDPFHKWMRENYFRVVVGTIVLSALIFGPKFAIYFFVVPAALAQLSGGLINVICHKWGYRSYETTDLSKNNFLVNAYALFVGVGLHNNHHKFPWEHKTLTKGKRIWHEVDWGGWFIEKFLLESNGTDWGKRSGPSTEQTSKMLME